MKNYETAQADQKAASWILQNADQERVLAGSHPGLVTKYQINGVDGSWRVIAKNIPA